MGPGLVKAEQKIQPAQLQPCLNTNSRDRSKNSTKAGRPLQRQGGKSVSCYVGYVVIFRSVPSDVLVGRRHAVRAFSLPGENRLRRPCFDLLSIGLLDTE